MRMFVWFIQKERSGYKLILIFCPFPGATNGPMTNMDTEHFHSSGTLDVLQHTYSTISTLLNRHIVSNGPHHRLPC